MNTLRYIGYHIVESQIAEFKQMPHHRLSMSMMGHFLYLNNCSHFWHLTAQSVPAVVAYGSTQIDGVGRFSFLNNCSHFFGS